MAKIKIQSYFTQLNQISHPVRWPRHLINTSWQQQLISLELAMKRVFPNSPSPKQNHLLFFFPLVSNTPYSGIMLSFALVDFQNQDYSSHSGSLHFYTHTYHRDTHTLAQVSKIKSLSFFILEAPKGKVLFMCQGIQPFIIFPFFLTVYPPNRIKSSLGCGVLR